jgi:hypothetical protein
MFFCRWSHVFFVGGPMFYLCFFVGGPMFYLCIFVCLRIK